MRHLRFREFSNIDMMKNTLAKKDIQGSINNILGSIPQKLDTEEDLDNLHIKHSQLDLNQNAGLQKVKENLPMTQQEDVLEKVGS